jgi:hypothetical protein
MSASRLLAPLAALAATILLATAGASALPQRAATPKRITAAGVGGVKLGATYAKLRAAGLVGKIGQGCELAGPQARSARLRTPLRGGVDFTRTTPRKAATISVTGGATARGVGIGASVARIKSAYPKVVADHSTDATFAITLYKVPRSGGGRLQFGVDTTTKKVTTIGIPNIPFCD